MNNKVFSLIWKQSGLRSSVSAIGSLTEIAAKMEDLELMSDMIQHLDVVYNQFSSWIEERMKERIDNVTPSDSSEKR